MQNPGTTQNQLPELAARYQAELALKDAELKLKDAELKLQEGRIARLEATVEKLTRMIFGSKSERFIDPAPDHPVLTGFDGILGNGDEPEAAPPVPVPAHERRAHRNQAGRMELPAHLPREERIIDVPEAEKTDPVTGAPLKLIGYETSERLACRRGLFVIVIKRAKYANPDRPLAGVITAPTAPCAIEKSLFDDSFLAWLLVSKTVDHLPVERIAKILRRDGLDISRPTLNGLFHRGAKVLSPLYEAMTAEILACRYVHADDTPVRMQDPGRGKTREGRFWGAVAGSGPPLTVYEFTVSREKKWPNRFFREFRGFLHADDYAGYRDLFRKTDENGVPLVRHAACWAHARRKFDECLRPAPRPEAETMLALIRRLYDIERQAKDLGLDPDAWLRLRQEQSRPIADAIFNFALGIARDEPPRSPLATAAAYMLRLKEQLSLFLTHPEVLLDNNPVENAHRPVAVGRKNWMFTGNEECGQNLAVVMSLTATCARLGINPQEYLADILPRIQDHPASKVRDLLPDRWAESRNAGAKQQS